MSNERGFYFKSNDEVYFIIEEETGDIYHDMQSKIDYSIDTNLNELDVIYQRIINKNPIYTNISTHDVIYDNGLCYIYRTSVIDMYRISYCSGSEISYENDNLDFIENL